MELSSSVGSVRLKPAGRMVLRRIGTDVLLVPVHGAAARKNRVYPLNRTGAFLWERLAAGDTPEAAARALAAAFQVEAEAAREDCLEFCRTLVEEGLLEAQPG